MAKRKFRTSEAAKAARQLDTDWLALQSKWAAVAPLSRSAAPVKKSKKPRPYYTPVAPPEAEKLQRNHAIRSLGSWVTGTNSTKSGEVYTGTAIVGICTMHKSNLVPVFSVDDAKAISKMRR